MYFVGTIFFGTYSIRGSGARMFAPECDLFRVSWSA